MQYIIQSIHAKSFCYKNFVPVLFYNLHKHREKGLNHVVSMHLVRAETEYSGCVHPSSFYKYDKWNFPGHHSSRGGAWWWSGEQGIPGRKQTTTAL